MTKHMIETLFFFQNYFNYYSYGYGFEWTILKDLLLSYFKYKLTEDNFKKTHHE